MFFTMVTTRYAFLYNSSQHNVLLSNVVQNLTLAALQSHLVFESFTHLSTAFSRNFLSRLPQCLSTCIRFAMVLISNLLNQKNGIGHF